ncbi:MAG TPA: GNAT family N-acetyltransferase [Solirubrobacteraceae bacterium]|nr:GNAT family N-acetyltransferase [Solirubrobacteraceae bacterium]
MPAPSVRPLEPRDIDAVHHVMTAAFQDLNRRMGDPPEAAGPIEHARVRIGRCLATDPGGSWVAERAGEVIGCALAIVREGVWGLSLLIVSPDAQSGGTGRELLARAFEYGSGARGWIVLASRDPRALRSYSRLGLDLHPAVAARGKVGAIAPPPGVRPGTAADLPLTEAVDRAVRGAAHGEDILAMLAVGGELLVLPERGYVLVRDGTVRQLAAFDDEAAATLLRAALASAAGRDASVEWMTGAQNWAIRTCLDAGLELRTDIGGIFLGGEVGPFRPYLPSGAYL